MECPYCSNKTKVTDKRGSTYGVRRRRECLKCKKRFTTHEKIVQYNLYIIKKDKSREIFSREKLEKGIEKAFEKRPVSKEKIEWMINEIEEQLRKKGKKEIPSSAAIICAAPSLLIKPEIFSCFIVTLLPISSLSKPEDLEIFSTNFS